MGGRGAGKTRAGAEWIRAQAREPKRIALVGESYPAARGVMIEGDSGLLAISPKAERPRFLPSRRRLEWPSGAIGEIFSAEDPDGLRGPQFHCAWADELCKWRYPQACWDMLQFGLRLGDHPRQCVTTTPRPSPLFKQILARSDCITARASTYANRACLPPAFFKSIIRRYENTRLGRQELNAELIEDTPGALWNHDLIHRARVKTAPPLQRIVVAVDPPASHSAAADECGIIAAGCSEDGHAYLLEDGSAAGLTPAGWAKRAIALFRRHKATRLVAEINQGGDMVENIIRQIAPSIPFRAVRARRSKIIRAEPVAALYEQSRIHHVGVWPELEDQLCTFSPANASNSPDRLDALVWALTDLLLHQPAANARMRRI